MLQNRHYVSRDLVGLKGLILSLGEPAELCWFENEILSLGEPVNFLDWGTLLF